LCWVGSFFIFFFLFVFSFIFSCGFLPLLVFSDQIVHVWFSFSELHLIHTFTSIPMEESFSSEHSSELFSNSFEHLLDGSGVTNECNWHFESFWWDITNGGFDVVWNPFYEIWGVFILYVKHLLINFFRWHSSSEHSGGGKISTVSWVRSTHHVFGIKHLLGKFWNGEGSINLGSSWG